MSASTSPAILRCGGDWLELTEPQFTCLTWMWRKFGHTATPIARMFSAGGTFDHGAVEDIGAFVADIRSRFGDPLTVGIGERGRLIATSDTAVLAIVHELRLPYLKHIHGKSDAVYVNARRAAVSKKLAPATLGDVTPVVELMSALDAFCRRVRTSHDPLEVELRDVYEYL